MSLTSISFFIFFLIVLFGCLLLRDHNEYKKIFLLISSYYFYASIDLRFTALLLILTLVNYMAGCVLARSKTDILKRASIAFSIIISLGILFYFKYANFFIESIVSIFSIGDNETNKQIINVLLPIGISFMTFQAITYPLDLYTKKLERPSSLVDFSLFMAFFPQLLSGPIVRASFFLPQLRDNSEFNDSNIINGIAQILRGLIKKLLIADILATHIVNPAFSDPVAYSGLFLLVALIAFSFQIYMDLSGYTDIALGGGRMLGYKLPINFNRPYQATSVANYWQRWHISMSSFFRDYLYQPLEGWRWLNVYCKLLIVFVAIGLWHGAGWNFILYGFIHGCIVGFEHYKQKQRKSSGKEHYVYRGLWLSLRICQIFAIVTVTRILFRSDDLNSSYFYIQQIFVSTSESFPLTTPALLALTSAILLHFTPLKFCEDITNIFRNLHPVLMALVCVSFIYLFTAIVSNDTAFLYFQF